MTQSPLVELDPSFWLDRPTLITGATGLLGANLTDALVRAGAAVVVLIRDSVPQSRFYELKLHEKVVAVRGDLTDADIIERAINEYEIEAVFHLGAQTIVGTANRNPLSTFESNVRGTWNVLEGVRRNKTVRRVIIASSDKAYGTHKQLPYSETAPLLPEHPYDASKAAADLIARSYALTYKLPLAITRCGNLYGEGDLNYNRIVPGTIRSILRSERPVIRSDGSPIRDYFYVQDAVIAYGQLAQALNRPELWGEAFNFSNELQITVRELVDTILRVAKRTDLEPMIQNDAKNEILHQYLSAEKARSMLQWKAMFDLETSLEHTIAWYRKQLQL